MIRDLVGVPWEYGEMDCWKLMILAQKMLWGRDIKTRRSQAYTPRTLVEKSGDILCELNDLGEKIRTPRAGDILVLRLQGGYHVATFVSNYEILHIYENHTSRVSRYSAPFKRRTFAIYRLREVI